MATNDQKVDDEWESIDSQNRTSANPYNPRVCLASSKHCSFHVSMFEPQRLSPSPQPSRVAHHGLSQEREFEQLDPEAEKVILLCQKFPASISKISVCCFEKRRKREISPYRPQESDVEAFKILRRDRPLLHQSSPPAFSTSLGTTPGGPLGIPAVMYPPRRTNARIHQREKVICLNHCRYSVLSH